MSITIVQIISILPLTHDSIHKVTIMMIIILLLLWEKVIMIMLLKICMYI